MSHDRGSFREDYGASFRRHLVEGGEAGLRSAYELGKKAIADGLSVLDMAEVHHETLAGALGEAPLEDHDRIARSAAQFFMESLGTLEMAQRGLYETRERARLEAQYAGQMRELARASVAVNSTMALNEMVELMTERARRIIGARAAITFVPQDGDWTRTSSSVSLESEGPEPRMPEQPHLPEAVGSPGDLTEPIRMGWAELRADSQLREFAELHGIRSWMTVPLLARGGTTLALLELFDSSEGDFSEKDEAILMQLSQIAAVAMQNAQLYQREHRIAETLQRSLLPERLPSMPGIELAARYVPASAGVEVGGDWYDVISLPGGRLGLALGDVAGKGIRAASVMGQLRMALRAYALEDYSPAIVMPRLDRFVQELDESHMATVVYLVLEPDTSKISFVNAGHPPPLLIAADGTATYLETEGSVPLGVVPNARFYQSTASMEAGATLVLYTDGLIETPETAIDSGLARLKSAATRGAPDLESLCNQVLSALTPDKATDDVALLAVQVRPLLRERFALRLLAEPQALLSLRRVLRRWLERGGVGAEEAYEITSACSEACANAIEHAYRGPGGEIDFEAYLKDQEVRVVIRDFGRWRTPRPGDRGRGFTLMRGLVDSVEVTPSPDGTSVLLRRRLHARDNDITAS